MIPGWKNDELAVGYLDGKRWGTPLDHPWMDDGPSWNLRCNGGMLTTIRDLHRWYGAVLEGRVLSSDATKTFIDIVLRKHSSGKRLVGLIGGNDVFNAIYVNIYDDKFVIALFTNVSEFPAEEVFQLVKERILGFLG